MENGSKGPGRPTKYNNKMPKRARRLCLLGLSDKQLAEQLEIDINTLESWKVKHEPFKKAIIAGRRDADAHVAKSLYHRAIGYSHPEEVIKMDRDGNVVRVQTTKHYPPDVQAAMFWLKNRHRALWRDVFRAEHTGPGGRPLDASPEHVAMAALTKEELKLATRLGFKARQSAAEGNSDRDNQN